MNKLVILSEKKLEQRVKIEAEHIARQRENVLEQELLMKQTDLAVLQSQINPHFLYNTLECIRGLALQSDQDEIADIAWSLSKYFRYGISGKSTIVTNLSEELENVKNYITIQQYRFKNRFSVSLVCEAGTELAPIPRLSLQPIVENAILHGLQKIRTGGEISILTERLGRDVQITISDNGCGMTPQELERLTEKINGENGKADENRRSGHSGIGMHNVNERIRMRFGKQYGLTVFSCPDQGTEVQILVPGQAEGDSYEA